jgi:hypothetical protein
MIISSKPEQYDGSWRIVLYDIEPDGQCHPQFTKPELDEHIGSYYVQRAIELERLQQELFDGQISPIGFFMEYHNMDIADLAARMKLSKGTIKKHLTPAGFSSAKVEALRRYARIFDVGVSDFFQFTYVPDEVSVEVRRIQDRLIQNVTITAKSPN